MIKEEFKGYDGNAIISFWKIKKKPQAIMNRIVAFCKKHDCYSGESLRRCDAPLLELPDLVSEIIDIIKFDYKWKELKPCPFCGHTPIEVSQCWKWGGRVYYIRCACGNSTDEYATMGAAIKRWNTRGEFKIDSESQLEE